MTQMPRTLLRRTRLGRSAAVQRPPWTDEARVRSACTSCGACIRACPEAILIPGPAATPTVDFTRGECTFCTRCADSCAEGVYRETSGLPWTITATISSGCLLNSRVSCRACTDFCETEALRFDLAAGAFGAVRVNQDACTGCGACVAACPTNAIALHPEAPSEKEPVA